MDIFGYYIPIELLFILCVIFGVLIICSSIFGFISLMNKSDSVSELVVRTNSWWKIAIGITVVATAPAIIGTIVLAYVVFVALREMLSIIPLRTADRIVLVASYFAIPIQFYLAYKNYYYLFQIFIPLVMFVCVSIILVLTGETNRIGRSMAIIPTILILTVYMPSHMVLLFHVNVPEFTVGAGGLIVFLIIITASNDIFQFTWGKLLGKRKILPKISPNKTWAGFIGGVITSSLLGIVLSFLTPLNYIESFYVGLSLGIIGFVGDSIISAVKRDLKIKDTDDLIPGHGGAMDRLDSIVLTTPAFYYLLIFFIEN
tara:strand:- start:246 stop:1190 length:945 start_codon:yes stop_codon:yes gene_type:complete